MDFDWLDTKFDLSSVKPREVEESFEDPFSIRLLPDNDYGAKESRFFCLGKTVNNRGLFSVFWTDGKRYRVIACRDMTAGENAFFERRNAEIG